MLGEFFGLFKEDFFYRGAHGVDAGEFGFALLLVLEWLFFGHGVDFIFVHSVRNSRTAFHGGDGVSARDGRRGIEPGDRTLLVAVTQASLLWTQELENSSTAKWEAGAVVLVQVSDGTFFFERFQESRSESAGAAVSPQKESVKRNWRA